MKTLFIYALNSLSFSLSVFAFLWSVKAPTWISNSLFVKMLFSKFSSVFFFTTFSFRSELESKFFLLISVTSAASAT